MTVLQTSVQTPVPVVFISKTPSPYMVELFDELKRQGECDPFVVYLTSVVRNRPWVQLKLNHPHVILDSDHVTFGEAMERVIKAPLAVFSYYTHPFALAALHARYPTGRPTVYWGERPGFLRLGVLGKWLRWLLLRPLRTENSPIWGVGKFGVEGYRAEFGPQHTYKNLPYASNLDPFIAMPRPRAGAAEERRFLFSGAFVARKGVTHLARAFVRLATENSHVRLVMVGDGPLRERLKEILKPVDDKVVWRGFVKWHDLPQEYSRGDVLCLPSRYDGWGMVVVEALAAGMPVIATNRVGAALELVENHETGWRITPDDEEALLSAMRTAAATNLSVLCEMGQRGRAKVGVHDVKQAAHLVACAAVDALAEAGVVSAATQRQSAIRRVLLVSNYVPDRQYSMQRYAALMQQGLSSHGVEVKVIRPPVVAGALQHRLPWFRKQLGFIDKFVLFPLMLRFAALRFARESGSLVHLVDQGNGVYLQLLGGVRHLVTCHDLIAMKAGTGAASAARLSGSIGRRSFYQRMNRASMTRSGWIACISQATRDECIRVLETEPDMAQVIYNPLDPFFLEFGGPRPERLPERYLLHVGNSAWYKNRPGLLRIYSELRRLGCRFPLVLMGSRLAPEEKWWLGKLNLEPHVVSVVQPDDVTVRAAYAHAEALVFPSLEEGFGWPVLEAQAQGCLVFASSRAPLTEAGGRTSVYIDPEDPPAAAVTIMSALAEERRTPGAVAARRAHAADFSLDRFVDGHLDFYERILASGVAA